MSEPEHTVLSKVSQSQRTIYDSTSTRSLDKLIEVGVDGGCRAGGEDWGIGI